MIRFMFLKDHSGWSTENGLLGNKEFSGSSRYGVKWRDSRSMYSVSRLKRT